jgi:hypothetical protein
LKGEAADPRKQEALRRLDLQRKRQQEKDVRDVMATPAGRRLVWRILDDWGGINSVNVNCDARTFFNEGRRALARDVLVEVQRQAKPDYVRMLSEALKAKEADDEARQALRASTEEAEET